MCGLITAALKERVSVDTISIIALTAVALLLGLVEHGTSLLVNQGPQFTVVSATEEELPVPSKRQNLLPVKHLDDPKD